MTLVYDVVAAVSMTSKAKLTLDLSWLYFLASCLLFFYCNVRAYMVFYLDYLMSCLCFFAPSFGFLMSCLGIFNVFA